MDPRRGIAAVLLMQGAMYGADIYSAIMSSPWAAEGWGGDPERAASAQFYIRNGFVMGEVFGFASSLVAGNWMPLIGVTAANAYMYWLYRRALNKAASQ
jgi:hypothetical protein